MHKKQMFSLNAILAIFFLLCVFTKNGYGQEKKQIADFGFWTVGNSATPRFGKNWFKCLDELQKNKYDFNCFLGAIADEPQTKTKILTQCGSSKDWLDQTIDSLIVHNCLGTTADSEYFLKVPVMTNDEMKRVQESLQPIAILVAERIKEDIPNIIKEYNELKLDSDPPWNQIAHLVIDKILIDGRFHHGLVLLEKERGFKKYYSQDQKKIPAYFMEKKSIYGTFGVNWYRIEGKETLRDVYFFHGCPVNRFEFPFNKYGRDKSFAEIFHRIKVDGSLKDLSEDEIKMFIDLGWVVNERLAVPIVDAVSLKVLYDTLEELGDDAAELVFDNFSVILDSYQQSPYSKVSKGAGDYIQVCYHMLFTGIINKLIDLKVLPPIPEPMPEYFGVYVTVGSFF